MRQRSIEGIEDLIAQYRNRGDLTRRAFCEKSGITLATLDYYLRRYGNTPGKLAPSPLARVEVKTLAGAGRFALVLANGRRIECEEAELGALIRIGEQA